MRITAFTAGSLTTFLRFGFQDADALVGTLGINFAVLNILDGSDYRSQVWTAAAAAPDTNGNPLSILPPRCAIRVTTAAATTLTYEIYATLIEATG